MPEINQLLDWRSNSELAGLPVVDAVSHRNAMRNLAAGVSIITTCNNGEVAGLTATAVCSVTAEPPRLVIFVNKTVTASSHVLESGTLCVNILAADQVEIAKAFAGMIQGTVGADRFNFGEWTPMITGAPTLGGALVNMDCRVVKVFDESTHYAFLCEILDTRERGDGAALVYLNGRFHDLRLDIDLE